LFRFFKHIQELGRFQQLATVKKRLVFYSEGKNYWVHLEGLIKELLENHDIQISFISSNENDPGLQIKHPRYHSFEIDEGWIRNWLFENIETNVMVMTMPDIGQYQVKRSKNPVHYVYLQHSLVSKHMVYRPGAFDHYDSIFCAAPHHLKEIRAIEARYNLPKKDLYKHGYARLDDIIHQAKLRPKPLKDQSKPIHILLAPSWGPNSIIETIGMQVVDTLLARGYQLTLRPHPQTIKFSSLIVNKIVKKHQDDGLFNFEANVDGQESLHQSDLMICDWSGAALDYAFGLNKPVVFIDVPRKVNNPDYAEIDIEPYEVSVRENIGTIVSLNELDSLPEKIEASLNKHHELGIDCDVFSLGSSAQTGAKFLMEILTSIGSKGKFS
jgi:CDP-glycerol glycerophosphotransferase (TagB/SpsB family)